MADDFQYDVFLSHSAKDKAIVRPIAERLRADGLRVWLDDWEIRPGDHIPAKIEEGLERSRVLVLCMSANALGSDWEQLELGNFRFRDPLNKERRFIPLRLDEAPIKDSLASLLYVNWRTDDREQAYVKLLEACRPLSKQPKLELKIKEGQAKFIQLDLKVPISVCAFSSDGKRALTAAFDNSIRLWDLETGRCLRVFDGPPIAVWSMAWSTDQRYALSGDRKGGVLLWNVETGRCLRVLEGHTGEVQCFDRQQTPSPLRLN